jgi:hypothetical protein
MRLVQLWYLLQFSMPRQAEHAKRMLAIPGFANHKSGHLAVYFNMPDPSYFQQHTMHATVSEPPQAAMQQQLRASEWGGQGQTGGMDASSGAGTIDGQVGMSKQGLSHVPPVEPVAATGVPAQSLFLTDNASGVATSDAEPVLYCGLYMT